MNNDKKRSAYRQGVVILFILSILTAVEYVYAINFGDTGAVILFLISFMKAVPILYFFMHIATLWSEEEGH